MYFVGTVSGVAVEASLECLNLGRGRIQEKQVAIAMGPAPRFLRAPSYEALCCEATTSEVLFRIPATASYYLIAAGPTVHINVDLEAGASLAMARFYLEGPVFASALQLLGRVVLHGAGVAFGENQAALFLGAPGTGKSSVAAALQKLEHPVVTDSICVAELAGPRVLVRCGPRMMTLSQDAVSRLQLSLAETVRASDQLDKYRLSLPSEGRPLSWVTRVYVFDSEDADAIELTEATVNERLPLLQAGLGHADRAQLLASNAPLFQTLAALARTRVFRIRRPTRGWHAETLAARIHVDLRA